MTVPPSASPGAQGAPLRPQAFPSPLAQPPHAAPEVIRPPHEPPPSIALPVAPARRLGAGVVWTFGVLALLLVVVVAYFLWVIGPEASLLGMVLALVPFALVLATLRLVDRWEPEPRRLVALALCWGAIAAVAIALGVDLLLVLAFGAGDSDFDEFLTTVVQAPVVEEIAKGLGLLVILAVGRRAFDGPVDGIVYGGLIGAGFAFTENIQYFAIALIDGGVAEAGITFFLRGILSPFAHVMFTAVTGLAVGLAARRGARVRGALGPWLGGLVGAIALHALWNGSALLGDFFVLYATLQVPLFVLFIVGVLLLRAEEARLTRLRLGEYAAAGWFTPQEVEMLATRPGRRDGLRWAATLPGDRTRAMRGFIHDAAALAAARQRVVTGRDPGARADEQALLVRTAAARRTLFSP